mgnify:CR=1 FL=1|tara:strand:+ start:3323 stop:4378 length:1056 start_codon:yes stop_codon:yes gene_type:complete
MANLFKDFDTKPFMKRKPPSNNSFDTDQEIKELAKIPINKKFINDKDDVDATFKKVAKQEGVEYPSALVKRLIEDSTSPILKLKKHFNRPRPHVLAKKRNFKLDHVELKSMKTPSYPSGHSAQGSLIAEVLADMYPKSAAKFRKAGKDISDSRNVARAHYKSDSKFGMDLGKEMHKHYSASAGESPMTKRLEWNDSKYPDAKGKFRDLSAGGLASWLMKTRGKTNLKAIIGSLNQQINFNTKDSDKSYRDKMERTKNIVRKRMGKDSPMKKQKGGGTTKTCLPAAKIRGLSKEKRKQLVGAKKSSGAQGKYKRSSKTNVKGARKPGATLRDWFQKEDWRQVNDPSKKCGEK